MTLVNSYPTSHLKAAFALTVILAIAINVLPSKQQAFVDVPIPLEIAVPKPKPKTPSVSALTMGSHSIPAYEWIHIKVKRGDNLAQLFQEANLPPADLHKIVALGDDAASLRKIMPGQELSLQLNDEGILVAVQYRKNAFETLMVDRTENGFKVRWQTVEPKKIIVYESATITKLNPSLYQAGKSAGLSDNIIMKLSDIYQWDISFALDLRTGDSFSLMYEEIYADGEKVKEGNIIASNFINVGKVHEAVRYTDLAGHSDFYTPKGHSMKKAFIRDPVHFSYVSSNFNLRRMHPIHKSVMPHRGIDYAAKEGTPVVSAGDGRVKTSRQNRASGRYIVIQHGEKYTTKYLHLSAFARGVKPGAKVKQGQTIGYVGSTGWATGPHLHYEFLVGNVHRNPKTVKLPHADPVAPDEMQRFRSAALPALAQLNVLSGSGYASVVPDSGAGK